GVLQPVLVGTQLGPLGGDGIDSLLDHSDRLVGGRLGPNVDSTRGHRFSRLPTSEAGARRRENLHGNLGIAGLRLSRCEGYLQLADCFIADGIGAARIDVDRDGRSDCSIRIIEQLYGRPSYGTDHLERFSVRVLSGTCNLTQVNGHT